MFEKRGRKDGERDGWLDAKESYARDPRPNLGLALAFNGYRDSYLGAYRGSYNRQLWINSKLTDQKELAKQEAHKISKETKILPALQKSEFERGWADGYNGREADLISPHQTKDTKRADQFYLRGYKLGVKDRDYARARDLQKQHQREARGGNVKAICRLRLRTIGIACI